MQTVHISPYGPTTGFRDWYPHCREKPPCDFLPGRLGARQVETTVKAITLLYFYFFWHKHFFGGGTTDLGGMAILCLSVFLVPPGRLRECAPL